MRFSNISILRSVAVLIVVAYHLGFQWAKGGYLGVTIFFCISGFLVTTGFLRAESGGAYFVQRIYRLLPAIFTLLTICVVLVSFWPVKLAPNTYSELVCSAVFIENVCVSLNAGYFSTDAKLIPVTHLWSLGLEVQFYLALYLLFKWTPRDRLFVWISALLVISIVSDVLLSRANLFQSYLFAPSRLWEFLAGCLIALRPPGQSLLTEYSKPLTIALVILLVLILPRQFTYFSYFSGKAIAVILSLTAILYWKDLPAFRITEFLGEHSYSIYLAHFPAIVAAGFLSRSIPEFVLLPGLFVAIWTLIYAADSRRSLLTRRHYVVAVPIIIFTQFALASAASVSNVRNPEVQAFDAIGFENAASGHWRYGRCFIEQSTTPFRFGDECSRGEKVLLVGDSHAAQLLPVLERMGVERRHISQLTVGGCLPDFSTASTSGCNRLIVDSISRMKIRPEIAVLSARFSDMPADALQDMLQASVTYLKSQGIRKVILLGNEPYFHPTAPFLFWKRGSSVGQGLYIDRKFILERLAVSEAVSKRVARVARDSGASFIDLTPVFCDAIHCKVGDKGRNELYFSDYDHLTVAGANYVGEHISAQGLFDVGKR